MFGRVDLCVCKVCFGTILKMAMANAQSRCAAKSESGFVQIRKTATTTYRRQMLAESEWASGSCELADQVVATIFSLLRCQNAGSLKVAVGPRNAASCRPPMFCCEIVQRHKNRSFSWKLHLGLDRWFQGCPFAPFAASGPPSLMEPGDEE